MEVFDHARATDLDPLSVFPSEAESGRQKVRHKEPEVESGHSSIEINALVSTLSGLQASVHLLAQELTQLQEIARSAREDADKAITRARSVETRISALEHRDLTRQRQLTSARPEPATIIGLTRTSPSKNVLSQALPSPHLRAPASHWWEWCATSWRRFLHTRARRPVG
jgi:hypothetical protein